MRKTVTVLSFALVVVTVSALDMGGKWSVRDEGVFGDAVLPGTLADSALGREQSYETWNAVYNKQERYALRLQHQYVGEAVWSRRVTVPASLAAKPLELFMERVMWNFVCF